MSRLPPQQQDFVADYAAKRQAQMERARMLRESREATAQNGGGGSGSYAPPPPPPPPPPQQQPVSSYGYGGAGQPQFAAPSQAQRPATNGYPSSIAPQQQAPPAQYLRASNGHPAPQPPRSAEPPGHANQPVSFGGGGAGMQPTAGSVAVSENDFRKAVSLGIITSEQSRQLWTALQQQGGGRPSDAVGGGSPGGHHHVGAPQVRSGIPTTSSLTRVDSGPKAAQQPPPPAQPVGGRNAGAFRDDPAWNDEPVDTPPARGGAGGAGRAPVSSHGRQQGKPDWNADDGGDGTFGAPPPVPGRAQARPRGFGAPAQDEPTPAAQPQPRLAPALAAKAAQRAQQQQQQAFDDKPASVAPSRGQPQPAYSQQQQQQQPAARGFGGRRGQEQPPPPPPPPEEDPAEVEEFLRQKREAAQRLAMELEEADTNEPMEECRVCGRNFRQSVIDRHEGACKTANKKRRQFDTKAQRADGVDGLKEAQRNATRSNVRESKAAPAAAPGKLPKWKAQHLQFQAAMAAVRQQDAGPQVSVAVGGRAGPGGGFARGAPPPPAADDFDIRVPCPHCGRKFADDTAKRHIPKCREIIAKPAALQRKR